MHAPRPRPCPLPFSPFPSAPRPPWRPPLPSTPQTPCIGNGRGPPTGATPCPALARPPVCFGGGLDRVNLPDTDTPYFYRPDRISHLLLPPGDEGVVRRAKLHDELGVGLDLLPLPRPALFIHAHTRSSSQLLYQPPDHPLARADRTCCSIRWPARSRSQGRSRRQRRGRAPGLGVSPRSAWRPRRPRNGLKKKECNVRRVVN